MCWVIRIMANYSTMITAFTHNAGQVLIQLCSDGWPSNGPRGTPTIISPKRTQRGREAGDPGDLLSFDHRPGQEGVLGSGKQRWGLSHSDRPVLAVCQTHLSAKARSWVKELRSEAAWRHRALTRACSRPSLEVLIWGRQTGNHWGMGVWWNERGMDLLRDHHMVSRFSMESHEKASNRLSLSCCTTSQTNILRYVIHVGS